MYIAPFWAGAGALVLLEIAALLLAAVVVSIKQNKKK